MPVPALLRTVAVLLLLLAAPSLSRADWRDEVKVLRIGFVAPQNVQYRTAQLEPFRAYLQARLELPVELIPLPTYESLIEGQAGARIHYAIYSAASFASASVACGCVEPLALPTAAAGEEGFHSVLLARSNSAIRTLADARGARLALAGADSVAGRLIPMKAFARQGIAPQTYFSRIIDKPDPKSAIRALIDGEADLAVGWSSMSGDFATGYSFGLLTEMVADADLSMDEVRIVWQSPLIPFGPHAVRSDLSAEFKALLTEALLTMAGDDPDALDAVDRTGGGGFAAVDSEIYAGIAELIAPAEGSP